MMEIEKTISRPHLRLAYPFIGWLIHGNRHGIHRYDMHRVWNTGWFSLELWGGPR